MSEEIFAEYRARIASTWVDVESCLLALEKRIERQKSQASMLKWAVSISGLLAGGAGLDVILPVTDLIKANREIVIAGLAFATGLLSVISQGLSLDTKIVANTEAQHRLLEFHTEARELLYALSCKTLTPADEEAVSIFEAKVDHQMRRDAYDRDSFHDKAREHAARKPYLQRDWVGPPGPAPVAVEAQGQADLEPLRRG
ncbi:hypothetical protein [Pseudaestuariivita atlantica]|uniref:SMODS and SLOG-associating 2TM effector domain-containing protein n=1 Tax=Pseudaestuariivita atlantica TaxID=1317121 RepID=A0A0L1JQN7_9RHOB|nr:hypothetical protein [Pseudaestuariivita atlantica]KNG94045.1 hypothetical protein ATO11_07255 [Pseudaestuariivita atlantica]